MKLDRKGFMLAEVVIVSVVVATVLVTLFTGLKNVSSAYQTRNRYYDVDSLYAAMDINDILIKNNSTFINSSTALELINDSDINQFYDFYKKTGYSIKSYLVPYNNEQMLALKDLNNNITFDEYIDYLGGNISFNENYNYIIIVERTNINDKDDCYYYALKLK